MLIPRKLCNKRYIYVFINLWHMLVYIIQSMFLKSIKYRYVTKTNWYYKLFKRYSFLKFFLFKNYNILNLIIKTFYLILMFEKWLMTVVEICLLWSGFRSLLRRNLFFKMLYLTYSKKLPVFWDLHDSLLSHQYS